MSDPWPDELSLDEREGPASYLTPSAREALVQNVLAQAYPRRSRAWIAAAIAVACIGGGSASAAVYWYATQPVAVVAPVESAPVTSAPRRAPVMPIVVPAPEIAPPVVVPPRVVRAAEDWLREGNKLRAAKRWKQADDAYSNAAREAANDDAAYVAFVASAGVRLEHLGDARGALHRYRAALKASPHGALNEEVRLGIADAYRALGDSAREREALELFLREHPQSPLAEQARARL